MPQETMDNRRFWLWLGLFALLGAGLRLWALPGQVLLDDEWHALNFVQNKTLADVFLKQGMGANSIPVNIYSWLVQQTVGWSEPALRLPGLLCGSATIVVVPLLGRRLWGERVAVIGAALIAVAPTLIFYSRVARPYGPVMLFGASSLLLTLIWLQDGRRRDLLLGAVAGAIAIYYHLYAAIPVGVPLGLCFLLALLRRRQLPSPTPLRDLSLAGAVLILGDGLLVVVPNLLNPWWLQSGIHGQDHATVKTVLDFLALVAGTPLGLCKVAVCLLVVAGLVQVFRRSWIIGLPLLAPLLIFTVVAAITSQEGSQAAIQVARYGITFFPLLFLLMAVAVERGLNWGRELPFIAGRRWLLTLLLVAVWSPFLLSSPLWRIYQLPNNFTNQSAYQYHYEPHDWATSPERDLAAGIFMYQADIPAWYSNPLVARVPGIVEYPMLLGDHFNFYYYYQHFHRRPVRVGYLPNLNLGFRRDQFVIANQTIDHVLRGMSPELLAKSNWQAMVNIADLALLRQRYAGWLVILHNDPMGEAFPGDPRYSEPYRYTPLAADLMQQNFGQPLYSDRQLAVWVVK